MNRKNSSSDIPRILGMPFAPGLALLYLLVAGLWIYFSDKLAEWMTETASQLRLLSTYKGWFFVVVTAGLLFLVLKRFISKIRLAQQKLRESESRHYDLINLAVDGILIGSHDGFVTDANERMCEILGLPREKIIGKHVSRLPFTLESLEKDPLRFDLLQQGKTVASERTFVRPDASEVIVEMHTKMMPEGSYQSIYRDITSRKQTEAKLAAQTIDLERFNKASVGRELRMIELKKEVNALCRELGKPVPYPVQNSAGHEQESA